jgi:CPA2 family monovalent cation:H+ antiporter-2
MPTLAQAPAPGFFIDLLVILAAAAAVAALFRRANLQTVTGFVVAGAIVGPNALGLVRQPQSVDQISSLATILLMFGIGLQLDVQHVRRGALSTLAIGVVSTIAVVLVIWPGGMLFGLSPPQALAVALAMAMSSTAVLLRVMLDRREVNQQHGRLTLGVSVVQDLSSVGILALMPILAVWSGVAMPQPAGGLGFGAVADALIALAALALFIAGGRLVLPGLMRAVAQVGQVSPARPAHAGGGASELILVTSAALAVGAALASAAMGLSPELGAFVAGFLLASCAYRHQLVGQFAPLRDLLLAVFFTAVGLKIDPAALLREWWVIATAVVAVIVVKTVVIGFFAWALGATPRVAGISGVYLATAGEFSFVVLSAAAAAGVIAPQGLGNAIAVAILTLIIVPLLMAPAHRWADAFLGAGLAPWMRGRTPPATAGPEEPVAGRRVIIAGYGPVGRHLADRFRELGMLVRIVDLNPRTVDRQSALGRDVVFGDVTNRDVLISAGIEQADALILTIPDEDAMVRACAVARALNPRAFIAARATYLSRALEARRAGADEVTVEEVATAEVMARQVVDALQKHAADRAAASTVPIPDAAQT